MSGIKSDEECFSVDFRVITFRVFHFNLIFAHKCEYNMKPTEGTTISLTAVDRFHHWTAADDTLVSHLPLFSQQNNYIFERQDESCFWLSQFRIYFTNIWIGNSVRDPNIRAIDSTFARIRDSKVCINGKLIFRFHAIL